MMLSLDDLADPRWFFLAATLVIDFYLDEKHAKEKKEIMDLSMDNTPGASRRLCGYVREALRLHPQVYLYPLRIPSTQLNTSQAPGIFRESTADMTIVEGNGLPPVNVQKGDRIFVSLGKANMDVSKPCTSEWSTLNPLSA
jgi:hypothetical protein